MPISQAVYLGMSQVATKAVTFASNQVLLRRISPEIFGIAAYLEFLVNSVLFFSREAVRVANQRATADDAIVNFAYLPAFLGIPVFVAFLYLQTYSDLYQNTVAKLPYLSVTLSLIMALIALELLAEPLFGLNQHRLNFKLRSKVESMAVFVKCITVFVGVAWWQRNSMVSAGNTFLFQGQAVLAFACGQFAYSAVIFLGYLAGSPHGYPFFTKTSGKPVFDPNLLSVWKLLFMQMVFKHLLTEGDTMIIGYLFTVTQQGVYLVIANYGSMVARLLFQPIEELLRASFTKSLSSETADYSHLHQTMTQLMSFYFNLSLLIVIGGYTNGPFLLRVLLGRSDKWLQSSVFEDFPIYVLYIPFMAFNGIFEAFFSSASSQVQISRFSFFMSLLSVFVFALMYVFIAKLGMGVRGLILANMANMTLRIIYCFAFYIQFFQKHMTTKSATTLHKIGVPLVLATIAMGVQQILFQNGQSETPFEFAQSILICVSCLIGMLINERQQIMGLVARVTKKGKRE